MRGLDRVEAGNAGGGNSPKAEQKGDMFIEYTTSEQWAGQQGRDNLREDGGGGPQLLGRVRKSGNIWNFPFLCKSRNCAWARL